MSERKFCAVDAEGDVGKEGLLGVSFYSGDNGYWITDHSDIIRQLYRYANEGYTFICHNASYDIPVIWSQLGLKPEYTYYNDRLHHGTWKYDKRKPAAQIWDTLDLSGGIGIEALGIALGIPKYETPQSLTGEDFSKYKWKCEKHDIWECVECYAIRDAEICYMFMDGFSTVLAGWGVKPSARLSGIALDTWKVLDNPSNIGIKDKRIQNISRSAYYGGRVECFKYGRISPVYTADVASMYPSVMIETAFPNPQNMTYLKDIQVSQLPINYEGVAEVDITVPKCHIPPLPYSHKGERIYPVGRMRGFWTLLEIRYAMTLGCVVNRVYQVAYSPDSVYPFTNFINVLWTLRKEYKEKNDPRQLFAKLLMNNLYGRLGARESPERMIIKPAPNGYDSRKAKVPYNSHYIGEKLYLSKTDVLDFGSEWTNVLWAAQITSAARVKLHKFILLQGISIAYCDTDSIFSTKPINGLGKGLGQLEPQHEYKSAIIAQPKLYALQDFNGEWQAKGKGVKGSVALQFLRGQAVSFMKPIKPKEGIRRGLEPGMWISVTRERRTNNYRRHPTNVQALFDDYGFSETEPLVSGPITEYTQ